MASIKGTNVLAPVVPFDTTDVHPTHEALYGRGGYRTVETTADRDAIPTARRETGMLVWVASSYRLWRLSGDLTTWLDVTETTGSVSSLSDVVLSSVTDGDLLRYSNGKWRNYPEVSVVDGGNF